MSRLRKIAGLQFSLLSNQEKDRLADVDVTNSGTKSNSSALYDSRCGPVDNDDKCFECNKSNIECTGHWAKIHLGCVIPHPYYCDTIKMILQCICRNPKCATLLYRKNKMEINGIHKLQGEERLKTINKYMITICEHSVCDKCDTPIYRILQNDYKFYIEYHDEKKAKRVEKRYDSIYSTFKNISNEDFNLLGFNSELAENNKYAEENAYPREDMYHRHQMKAEDLFIETLLVVPPCIRPYTKAGRDMAHDDLTTMYNSIIKKVKDLNKAKTKTELQKAMDLVQNEVYNFMSTKAETTMGGRRAQMNIPARIKGKKGQFRTYLEATRCDYGGRSVLGPDPYLRVGEIGIPQSMRKITQAVRIADYNRDHWNKQLKEDRRLMTLANKNDKERVDTVRDGINSIYLTRQPFTKYDPEIQYIHRGGKKYSPNRPKIIKFLRNGDVLDVKLRDGMKIIFNRQPTIREESMNAHTVRIHKEPGKKTITINPSVCTAYNADQ